MENRTYITKKGLWELKQSLRILREKTLPSILTRYTEAVGMGDLRENSEYAISKAELDIARKEIARLESIIKNSDVPNTLLIKTEEVKFGSKVVVEEVNDKIKITFSVVGEHESNVKKGLFSFLSPFVMAFLGKKTGQVIKYKMNDQIKNYQIISVSLDTDRFFD